MEKPVHEPPPLVPYLTVDNGEAAIAFYQRAFGAELREKHFEPNGKRLIHAELNINGATLMLSDDFAEMSGGERTPKALGGSSITLHLNLKDVDPVFARAVEAGAMITMPLADQFWGDRYGKLRDPFGHEWSLSTRKQALSEAEVKAGADKYFGKP